MFGSILAPYAEVDSMYGQINGNLIVKRLEGHIESHLHLFRPTVMPPDPEVAYTDLKVEKIWDDNADNLNLRPHEIRVSLFKDGGLEPLETVILSEENNWSYHFKNLLKFDGDREIKYTIFRRSC